ncbi:hypothetical protein ACFC06_07770, partial [Nocardia sp. NPDC056064]|uniref:hypothetical protein n=1 Tax=Nocardia sp. NPDC056064 TaxID=3345701 RepID=UPI0035D764D7
MNHAEHDETIGSMLASIAAALREVSEKLDVVAARVQQEVPPFPGDDDVPDQIRIRRLESWAFHASQDISRLSSRLDALDGGDPEPGPRGPARTTPSRREVREAAEAAERAAEAVAPEPPAPHPFRNIDGARPPLERRQSALRPTATDHLGDPTWPITVTPVPRAAHVPSGVAVVTVDRDSDLSTEVDERHSAAIPVEEPTTHAGHSPAGTGGDELSATGTGRRNGVSLDRSGSQRGTSAGSTAEERRGDTGRPAPATNGFAAGGIDSDAGTRRPGNDVEDASAEAGKAGGVAAGIGAPTRGQEVARQDVDASARTDTGTTERSAPQRLSDPGSVQSAGHSASNGSPAPGAAASRHAGPDTAVPSGSEVSERAVSFSALSSTRTPDAGADRRPADDGDRSGAAAGQRGTADERRHDEVGGRVTTGEGHPGEMVDDQSSGREGHRGRSVEEPAIAIAGAGAGAHSVVVDGVIGAGRMPETSADEHLSATAPEVARSTPPTGVERARPASRLTDGPSRTEDPVRSDVPAHSDSPAGSNSLARS